MIILKDGKPFEGAPNLDPAKVAQAVRDGLWDDAALAKYGLEKCEPFVPPEGKVASGEARYVETKEGWAQEFDVVDAVPEREMTKAELLFERTGLTVADLKELLAK